MASLKGELAQLKSELDDEREAKERALSEASTLKARSPPATPAKAQPNGTSPEDLAKLHQAHEAKVSELESTLTQQIKALQEEKDELAKAKVDVEKQLEREKLEKNMYEESSKEDEEEIARYESPVPLLNPPLIPLQVSKPSLNNCRVPHNAKFSLLCLPLIPILFLRFQMTRYVIDVNFYFYDFYENGFHGRRAVISSIYGEVAAFDRVNK